MDQALGNRGYRIIDPVVAYAVPVGELDAVEPPGPDVIFCDSPIPKLAEIWMEDGIDDRRLDLMRRVAGNKTCIVARCDDQPGAAAFVAMHGRTAMVHALYVRPQFRRRGVACGMMAAAAAWSCRRGALSLAIVVTEANSPARELYRSLGMVQYGSYHYRLKPGNQEHIHG